MPDAEQNHRPDAGRPYFQGAVLKALMWACLGLAIPVALGGAPHKFDEPWGTTLILLLFAALLFGALRFLFRHKPPQNEDAVEQHGEA